MKVVRENITVEELKKMSEKIFGGLVKAVVDIEKEIMVVDAELHADEELLVIRPSWGNKSHRVNGPKIQEKIRTVVNQLVVL